MNYSAWLFIIILNVIFKLGVGVKEIFSDESSIFNSDVKKEKYNYLYCVCVCVCVCRFASVCVCRFASVKYSIGPMFVFPWCEEGLVMRHFKYIVAPHAFIDYFNICVYVIT